MGIWQSVTGAWLKHAPEIRGLVNGAIASFVTSRRPSDVLDGVPVFSFHLTETEAFEADLAFLAANGYQTIGGQDLLDYLNRRRKLPERSVLLTFDDGPRNFHDKAFPLLLRYGARAVAFIAPGLHAYAENEENTEARPMTWEEIAAIHHSGLVEFQSHTLESRYVPDWPAPVALAGCRPDIENPRRGAALDFRTDVERSRALLTARLSGTPVNQLAFPMYHGSERAIADAKSVGIEACYWGLLPGRPLNRAGASPFHISRMSDEFLRRLPGTGRITTSELARIRIRRIRWARAWRRQHAGHS